MPASYRLTLSFQLYYVSKQFLVKHTFGKNGHKSDNYANLKKNIIVDV